MNEIQEKILAALKDSSKRGKPMLYPKDLAKKVGMRFRAIKPEVQSLIESQALAYYYPGSSTYIMLKSDFDVRNAIEEKGKALEE